MVANAQSAPLRSPTYSTKPWAPVSESTSDGQPSLSRSTSTGCSFVTGVSSVSCKGTGAITRPFGGPLMVNTQTDVASVPLPSSAITITSGPPLGVAANTSTRSGENSVASPHGIPSGTGHHDR